MSDQSPKSIFPVIIFSNVQWLLSSSVMLPVHLALLTMVSNACFTLATSKYCNLDDIHVFPASFALKERLASVCTLELMLVDKMLVKQSLFVMYFTTNQFEGSKCTPTQRGSCIL
ncbi:uncharacterized protein LOC129872991 isoform X2 [Solanum dulcamara]|uniref:uncharacterized protein LOC129872189 isoform X2 n=1 Tax=Solanum dulcamara TaxID=45834 RepID=UPI002486707B|nr:uncharacterized protein LOC129872189 isoform X2 [Solanum dulcamara]XP_055803943.1 uncharacterized protein LOC129872991 isoform X2 [Solanum dulcamara]